MSDIVKFENLESKLIEYKNEIVLIDSDVAELTKKEKKEVVENFHHLSKLKYSPYSKSEIC